MKRPGLFAVEMLLSFVPNLSTSLSKSENQTLGNVKLQRKVVHRQHLL